MKNCALSSQELELDQIEFCLELSELINHETIQYAHHFYFYFFASVGGNGVKTDYSLGCH